MTATFNSLESIAYAPGAIASVLAAESATLPAWAVTNLNDAINQTPVERVVYAMETLFAAKASLGDAGKLALAQLADIVTQQALFEQGKNGRSLAILKAARRERGEDGAWPDPSEDPAVDPRWGDPG